MGGLLPGRSKAPPGPSREELDKQEEREERAEAGEAREKRKIASKARSRRSGGQRLLMAQDRDNPALGNEMGDTTLGPGRNPRA